MRRQPWLGVQHQRLCHENVVSHLAEIDGRHPGRLSPGEPLQEPGKEHDGHSCAERGGDAAAATSAERDDPQVVLGERDIHHRRRIRRDVAVGIEAEWVVPDGRVAAEANAAKDDVASLGDVVAGDVSSVSAMWGTYVEWHDGVEAERLSDAGLYVVEPWDVGLLH